MALGHAQVQIPFIGAEEAKHATVVRVPIPIGLLQLMTESLPAFCAASRLVTANPFGLRLRRSGQGLVRPHTPA